MSDFLDFAADPVKALFIGDSGNGKTGALASLVLQGYELRIIDTDKGVRILRSLLLDSRYPYAKYVKEKEINLNQAVKFLPIDTQMDLRNVPKKMPDGTTKFEQLLAPKDAKAWPKVLDAMNSWPDGEAKLPHVYKWTAKQVLVIDTLSTLAQMVYYYAQSLESRLGANEAGYDFQRDVGVAQNQLRRFLEMLTNDAMPCNVLVLSHITRVDLTQGFSQSPEQRARNNAPVDAKGYPAAIGRALSPMMGKFFNDVYVAMQSGSGQAVRRKIVTVPTDNISAKNSAYVEKEYNITTGLAEIFCALRNEELDPSLVAIKKALGA